MNNDTIVCPLCDGDQIDDFHRDKMRDYLRCRECQLIFVPQEFHLSLADEKAEYDLHQNSPTDDGYRKFLRRIFEPVNARLKPASEGFDFGCGPGPTLSVMFEESGHSMSIFDPFYSPDPAPLNRQYDFVTTSEVVEHLRDPKMELNRIWSCVKPGGMLAIMTKQALTQTEFEKWHYKNDRTHICFFSHETFTWLARTWARIWDAEVTFVGNDVVIFERRKNQGVDPSLNCVVEKISCTSD